MKNYIKTLMTGLFALTLMAGFAVNAHAQAVSDNADVGVSATVLEDISVDQVTDLAFGNVNAQTLPSINPTDGTTNNIISGSVVGKFTVTGAAGASININWTTALVLDNGSEVDIQFNPSISRLAGQQTVATSGGDLLGTNDDGTTSADFDLSNTDGSPGTIGQSGEDTFFVGGSLSEVNEPGNNLPIGAAGTYSGNLTITASYN